MILNILLATILILNVATNARVIDFEDINSTTTTDIEITDTDIPISMAKTISSIHHYCPVGKGDVTFQKIECNNRNGRFFKKFYDYPACYSDFVCFLPVEVAYLPVTESISSITTIEVEEPEIDYSNCITIGGIYYCSADISNIGSCQFGSTDYDFKKCISEASERLSDLKKFVMPQPIIPAIMTESLTTTITRASPISTPITTTTPPATVDKISKTEIFMPQTTMPVKQSECALGKGVVTDQLIDCEKRNGRFFKKFHPYPECYSDYVCFLPTVKEDPESSTCVYIEGKQYCQADITNIDMCSAKNTEKDVVPCAKICKGIFNDFSFDYNIFIPKPYTPMPMSTTLPVVKPSTTNVIITTSINKINITNIPVVPVTAIPKPVTECPLGKGVVMNQLIDCEKMHGRFYKKFHPYPECFSDFVCFLSPQGTLTPLSVCIYIQGRQYCQADITNIDVCRPKSANYDLLACANASKKIFSDLKYDENPPLPTPFRPYTPIIKASTTTTTTTTTKTEIFIPQTTMPVKQSECALGKGVVTDQLIDCEKRNGRFFKKFHPYPECYSDYVCFLPTVKEDPESSTCVYIEGKQYCQADITNIDMCSAKNTEKDVVPCAKICKGIFNDFSFDYNIFIPKPYTAMLMSTTLPMVKPSTTASPPTTTTTFINDMNKLINSKDCLNETGKITHPSIECAKKDGKFYQKFHPYSDCYSDYVCFIPDLSDLLPSLLTKCIYIDNLVYCTAEMSTIKYCKIGSQYYDFKKCVEESARLFGDFTYKPILPATTTVPSFVTKPVIITKTSLKPSLTIKPITIPVIDPTIKPKTKITVLPTTNVIKTTPAITIASTSKPRIEPTIKPMTPGRCLLGQGDTMLQYIDCTQLKGKFYSKGHGYPQCYADYICFIPKVEDIDSSSSSSSSSDCINIDGQTYCSVEITNVQYCNKKKNDYDFRKCIEKASTIFDKFSYQPVPSDIPIEIVPSISKNFIDNNVAVDVDVDVNYETDSSIDDEE
ncbi:hypothetical protein PIROE2DRAFT_14064 [Piromyces sp. E2]|nr:hypothetical protein PIROE2DRAFT_14064 [Piromyces sp. E2]|eukprot:OUM60245.1 hypothetical protein PIROE2DRAFT_14064 [Piromyces sp. E2]